MLISRKLVKAFSEQLPSFICWTLDFGGTSRHFIRTSGIKSSRGETNMARALTNTLHLNDRVTEYNLQKFSA